MSSGREGAEVVFHEGAHLAEGLGLQCAPKRGLGDMLVHSVLLPKERPQKLRVLSLMLF